MHSRKLFPSLGIPSVVQSDQGSNFHCRAHLHNIGQGMGGRIAVGSRGANPGEHQI